MEPVRDLLFTRLENQGEDLIDLRWLSNQVKVHFGNRLDTVIDLLLRYRVQGVLWTDYGQYECLLLRYREGLDKLTYVFEDELSGSVLDNRLLVCCWLFSCIHINIWRHRMRLMLFVSPRFPTAVAWEPYVLMTYFMKFSFLKVIFHENWLISGRFPFRL